MANTAIVSPRAAVGEDDVVLIYRQRLHYGSKHLPRGGIRQWE